MFIQTLSRIFSDFQGYWWIFSHTHRRAARGRSFEHWVLKNIWVKFSIENIEGGGASLWSLFFLCFWQNVYRSALVPWNLPCPEKFLVACLHSGIVLFAKRSIFKVWQYSEYASVSITTQNSFRIQTHSEFWHIQHCSFQVYAGISNNFSVIQRYIQRYGLTSFDYFLNAIFSLHAMFIFFLFNMHSAIILFAKRSVLNVCQCSKYFCLDNCSVICTGALC